MTSLREDSALSDFPNTYKRNHTEYTYRLPTPPRIVVPPPTLGNDMPGLTVNSGLPNAVDLSFMKQLDLKDIIEKNTLVDWAYERRRKAQMILPWLYLGPMVAAKDKNFLVEAGITMAFAIRARENSMTGAIQASSEVCAEVATIEVPTFHDLIGRFFETTNIINSHVARYRQHTLEKTGQPVLGKVLVYCESGNEKSAAVVAAYLMNMLQDFDHVNAMQICQAQRFCVNFDDILKNILRSHWDILDAQRKVAEAVVQANGSVNGSRESHSLLQTIATNKHKRTLEATREDEDVNMDEDMNASDDALRFAGRDSTPFQ